MPSRKVDQMQKIDRRNSYKEGTSSLPPYKTEPVYKNEEKDRVPAERKGPLDNEVGVPFLLTVNKVRDSLKGLDGWQSTDDHKMIYREFILQDFMAAIDLIDQIALIAEDEKHHPDIHLTQYRNLRIGLTTHDLGGLSKKDFTVALKIKDLPILFKKHNNGVAIDRQPEHKDKPAQRSRSLSSAPKKDAKKTKVSQAKRVSKRPSHKA